MSFVVMGMEMPKDCIVCYDTTKCFGTGRYFEDGTIRCGLAKGYIGLKDTSEKCPLVQLPEKHGPMIDCQALLEEARRISGPFVGDGWSNQGVFSLIARQPTIVEAEGDE